MPYIKEEDRGRLEAELFGRDLFLPEPKTAGELNYVITLLAHEYAQRNGNNYQAMNDVLGAFDGCMREFYRRKVAPYEDIKIQENGDV